MPITDPNTPPQQGDQQEIASILAKTGASNSDTLPPELNSEEYLPQEGMTDEEVRNAIASKTSDLSEESEPKQAFVFHTAERHLTLFINTKAREHARDAMHGHIQHKRGDEGHNVEVKFEGGRFVTFDADFADLMQFCIKKWPEIYGRMAFGHTQQTALATRASRLKTEAAKRQIGHMVGAQGEDALIEHAQRAIDGNQPHVAEALLEAAENIGDAAAQYAYTQGG